jgi:HD-GYP domain-containing protein (c-di-GMP phosphodiesterase class II)
LARSRFDEEGRKAALDILAAKRQEIIAALREDASPSTAYYAFLKQTRKKFFSQYVDALKGAIADRDTTDFLGNETFQSYSHAVNGFALKDVLQVPAAVRLAIHEVMEQMVGAGEMKPGKALAATVLLDDVLDEAQLIRAQSFIQTRDEALKFFQSYQEEIDRFPSSLASTLDFSTLMRASIKKCMELVDVQRCAIFTRDLVSNELHLMASNFEHDRVFGDATANLDESVIKQLVQERKPVLIEGYRRSIPQVTGMMKRMKTKVILLVPLMVRDRNLGVMLLDNPERPQMFTPDVVNLSLRFANRVAGAMENARLHGSEQQKLKEMMALLEVARLVTSTLDIDVLLSRLAQITADVCEVGKCSVYIYIDESGRFYPAATFGMFPDSNWETGLGEGVMTSDLQAEEAKEFIEDYKTVVCEPNLCPFIPPERIDDTGIKSIVLVPIYSRDRMLGMMVLYYNREKDELSSDELNLSSAVAGQAAVALENAGLYEDLEMSYFSTVKALARAIEVKDPYTYGHSERVTDYALAICRQMELSEWETKNIKYAAALHDIGKIGIARKILDKEGSLSDEEFVQIKTHPLLGDSIMEPVAFLQEPRKIILHHHERYDGNGYPDGLKGENIPLGARILAVSDSFEAMMSDRPYREALPLSVALRELEVNAGTQFDPDVVQAFLDVIKSGGIPAAKAAAEKAEEAVPTD